MVGLGLANVALVALLKVLGENDIAVFPHGLHASLLADGGDLGTADLVGARDDCRGEGRG